MEFEKLIEVLNPEKTFSLPGEEAQFKLSPLGRATKEKALKQATQIRKSAVLILFYPHEGDTYISMIRRNDYRGIHSGQISFPGGKVEDHDEDHMATAYRETEEEIGVSKKELNHLGELTDLFIPPSNFLVKPYMAYSEKRPVYDPDPREVQEVLEVPLSHLMEPKNVVETTVISGYRNMRIKTRGIQFNDHLIWGATAMMISELNVLIKENLL